MQAYSVALTPQNETTPISSQSTQSQREHFHSQSQTQSQSLGHFDLNLINTSTLREPTNKVPKTTAKRLGAFHPKTDHPRAYLSTPTPREEADGNTNDYCDDLFRDKFYDPTNLHEFPRKEELDDEDT